ncbi:MAG TPA: response regulator [Terriglobales bacterium]|jgi:CheY-like chemotaxis protein|nr:response regulator [Terriglobales bacterium]
MKRILIVEDKPSSRELLRTVLEQLGYEVLEARDGEEGLRLIRDHKPKLVFMDLQIPLRNGYEVLQEVRKDPGFAQLPIVAITANAMPGDRDKTLAAGFTGYIAKPVSLAYLRSEISRLLGEEEVSQ